MKFFSQELNFITSPTIREGGKNYFSQAWKTILHCFSSRFSREQNAKSKKYSLTATVRFSYIYF